jgi:PAS domain S-box-containing protein
MISRRKTLQDETKFEKLETRVRNTTYGLMHELLQAQLTTPLTYNFLLLIEAIQFFWYTVHSQFDFLWTADFADWVRKAVKYFQVDAALRESTSSSIFLILFYVFFAMQLIMLLLAVVTAIYLAKSKRKTSTVLTYSLKVLSVYGLLINHVLALPAFQLFINAMICNDADDLHGGIQCYQGIYFFHLVMGIIGFITFFSVSILFCLLYNELNPYSKIPFASPQSKLNLGKILLKIVIPLYFTLDYKANLVKGFIVVYGIIWLSILVLKYRQTPCYNKSVFRFSLALESIILWSCLISIITAFIDGGAADDISLFYLFFGMPFAAYAAIHIIERRAVSFRQVILKNLNKDTDVEMYLNTIFNLIENREKPDQKMALEGLLKFHIKHCNKKDTDCVCYSLSKDYMKDEEPHEKLWYSCIKSIIVDVLDKYPKSARLHILYAYVQREKLNNKYKALFEIMIARENKPSVEQEFAIYRYKSLIEEEIIDDDSKTSETKGIDVNIIVHFQNMFVAFQAALENAVELHLDFWRELLEANPGIYKLQSLGSMITHSVEEISERYKKLNDINPNHIKMLQSYGQFLKNIVNDDVEGQRVLEKADYVIKSSVVNKQFIENDRLKYGENSNTCIITVSGNLNKMGNIKNINNEITRILGFSKADLIGQNINRIIPKYLAEIHDGLMRNYFETSESKIMGMERLVFPLTKKGYVVPCTLMIKVLPDLTNGVRLVGFLNEVENENGFTKNTEFENEEKVHYIVYSGDTGAIHGFTNTCKKDFGLISSLIYGAAATNDFTMDVIFPDLLNHNIEDLKNPAGVITTLDTSTLQQDYLLAHTESEKSDYDEEQQEEEEEEGADEKKYRKTSVRAVIVDDAVYQNVNLRVLKFTEILEDKDMRKITSVRNDNEVKEEKLNASENAGQYKEEEHEERNIHEDQNVSVSDKESNASVDGAGDELKALKDFKALISEKTEPRSIKTLSRAVILLHLILIALACVELSFQIKQGNEFEDSLDSLVQAYSRHNILADINFKTRQLYLLAKGQLGVTTFPAWSAMEGSLKSDLITLIDELSTVQFNIMKSTEKLQADGVATYDSENIVLVHLLDSGWTDTESRIYTDAIFQYITAASSVRNSTIASLLNLPTDTNVKNFYFVKKNGLGPLRDGSEKEAEIFYNYYINKTKDYNTVFVVIMVVGIVVLIISELILIPIVFSVHKTNNRVLSLFGYIPVNEIDQLAAKCEEYMEKYLEDHKERRDYSFEGSEDENAEASNRQENVDSSYLEVSQHQDVNETDQNVSRDISLNLDVSEQIKASPIALFTKQTGGNGNLQDSLKVPQGAKSSNVTPRGNAQMALSQDRSQASLATSNVEASLVKRKDNGSPQVKEEEKKKDDAEMELEIAYSKSQKLLNSKDNRRSKVMIQFIGLAIIFGIYFLISYLWIEKDFISDTKLNLQHLKLSAQRMSEIRYLNTFTQEEIAEANKTFTYTFEDMNTGNLRESYQTALQNNDKEITDPSNLDLSGVFNSYLSTFTSYTNNDLCSIYYEPLGQAPSCNSLGSGLLSSGLTLAITTISLNTADVVKAFYIDYAAATAANKNGTQLAYMISSKLTQAQNGMDLVMPPLSYLLTSFEGKYQDFISKSKQTQIIKFVIYIIFCCFTFVLLWLPYRKSLSDKIFRTKGMLNMIPMDIITKNENLKGQFLAVEILQAVK